MTAPGATERDRFVDQLKAAEARLADITAIVRKAQDAALAAVLHVRDLEFAATRGVLQAGGPELAAAREAEYQTRSKLDTARLHLDRASSDGARAVAALESFDADERRQRQAEWVASKKPEYARAIESAESEVARLRQPTTGLQRDGSELAFAVQALNKARAALATAIDRAPVLEAVHG